MEKQTKRMLALAIITLFLAMAGLLPGVICAGNLEPTAPPSPTMKTLDEIYPAWSKTIDDPGRFELVMGGEAVLDRETGLVWERAPDPTLMTWTDACTHCYRRQVVDRLGWRLPTVEELASLIDKSQSGPALPSGHPFINPPIYYIWSSTTDASDVIKAWSVNTGGGGVWNHAKTREDNVWCVRGGPN